jgi:hypothetical protein
MSAQRRTHGGRPRYFTIGATAWFGCFSTPFSQVWFDPRSRALGATCGLKHSRWFFWEVRQRCRLPRRRAKKAPQILSKTGERARVSRMSGTDKLSG